MSFYENLVMRSQMNYSRNYGTYAMGGTPLVPHIIFLFVETTLTRTYALY